MNRTDSSSSVVLETFARPDERTNPYLTQLFACLGAETEVLAFTWRNALRGRYDVLHLHLPESLMRGAGPLRTWARRLAFVALVLRCRWRRVAVVRTLHNARPHEDWGRVERALFRLCDAETDWWIRLNPVDRAPDRRRCSTILHGHYRDWYAGADLPASTPGRLVFFGLVRTYKGVDDLVRRFTAVDDPAARLHVAGAVREPPLASTLRALAAADSRVELEDAYLDDDRLAAVVGAAQVVVLPYRELGNSGAALLALSLGRPVLLPANAVTEALRDEVGPGWVDLVEGDLEASDLVRVLHRPLPPVPPDLGARGWATVAADHLGAFAEARAVRRRRGRVGSP